MARSNVQLRNSHQGHFLDRRTNLEGVHHVRQTVLTDQAIRNGRGAYPGGVSGVALADDSGMNPLTGDSSQNRGNLNVLAQSPCPQGTDTAGTRPKKDEQKIESKSLPAKRGTPITSPTYFNQYPGQ
jgi:hypothetical protein